MKLKNPLLAVTDLEQSVAFYRDVLGLRKIADFGANVTLTGGLSLQTQESWAQFLERRPEELGWCGQVRELYFEEAHFAAFIEKLNGLDMHYVHPVKEHRWGQRVVRFFDPDCHSSGVGERLSAVGKRFVNSGMAPEQIAAGMESPLKMVQRCLR